MRSPKKAGKRHTLLFYRHTMDRLWKHTLLLNIVFWLAWGFRAFSPENNRLMAIGAVISLAVVVLAFITRNMAYIQAHPDHIRLRTPFLFLKISYRRIKSIRPQEIYQIYSKGHIGWAQMRFLKPYLGLTVATILLKGYPLPPFILRLFLHKLYFYPKEVGFVLAISDWMSFNTEIDSMLGAFRQNQKPNAKKTPVGRGLYG